LNKKSIWVKVLLTTFLASALAAYLGFFGTHFIFQKMRPKSEEDLIPATAKLIKKLKKNTNQSYETLVQNFNGDNQDSFYELSLLKNSEYKGSHQLELEEAYEEEDGPDKVVYYKIDQENILVFTFGMPRPKFLDKNFRGGKPPLGQPGELGPPPEFGQPKGFIPPSRPPVFDRELKITTVKNDRRNNRAFMRPTPAMMLIPVTLTFLIMLFVLLLGAFIFIVISRKYANQAKEVLAEMKLGNLKARFPISKLDEFSEVMVEFNSMAGEIEKLVVDLQDSDNLRRSLLQELAHDLRTPISSMRSLLETILYQNEKMTKENREESLILALKEIEYFYRLVEDLLFLSGVNDFKYRGKFKRINLSNIVLHEAGLLKSENAKVKLTVKSNKEFYAIGDEHLLKRLIKNAISNAAAYAKSEVIVSIDSIAEESIQILVQDDGPGLKEDDLKAYGKKRATRRISESPNGKISIGLGAVIMGKIVDIHSGKVLIKNIKDETGKILGACLVIELSNKKLNDENDVEEELEE
jgi:signal transduction histidine kinase